MRIYMTREIPEPPSVCFKVWLVSEELSHLAVDELLLHVQVLAEGLQGRAQGGPGAEQPVVQLLGLAVVALQRLLLPLLLQLLVQPLLGGDRRIRGSAA